MRLKRFYSLVIAVALMWVGLSASVMAFDGMAMGAMAGAQADEMAMMDCPEHPAKMMETSTCVTACYGLGVSVGFEPLALVTALPVFYEAALERVRTMEGQSARVPTPPPTLV